MSADSQLFLQTAASIGDSLCRDALWWEDCCTWLSDDILVRGSSTEAIHRTCSFDIYSGTAGLALFLSALAKITGDSIHRRTALAAIKQTLALVERTRGRCSAAFFTGLSGAAWAALQVGESVDSGNWIERGLAMFDEVSSTSQQDWMGTDVIHGRAGAIVAALRAGRQYARPALAEWARTQATELVQRAHKEEIGWSWPEQDGLRGMNGFSHGSAGIAWALGEMAWSSGLEEFRDAAREAVRYEQHWFDRSAGNWPDFFSEYLADPERPLEYSMSWCHGAPGISLSRIRLWERFSESSYREQALAGIETTQKHLERALGGAPHENFSLCHGLSGNAEPLLIAARAFDSPGLAEVASDIGRLGITEYAEKGLPWPCGVNYRSAVSPGLMLGRAGTGYFYLRLCAPHQVPSVLLLDC
jgi:lantibiotic modifying enzyme